MTESTSEATTPEESEVVAERETTESGRYIPYSGGSMGWFENSGVLKCEGANNYLFYTEMASEVVRSTQFKRWGERFNRRGDKQRFRRMIGVTVGDDRDAVRGTTRDISRHGVRVQFLDEVVLEKGDKTSLKLYQDENSSQVVFSGNARVMWSEKIGKIRPVWNLGLTFEDVTAEQDAQLKPLLHE